MTHNMMVYKLVCQEEQGYFSWATFSAEWKLKYELDKETKAAKGLLFAFESERAARNYSARTLPKDSITLLLCEPTGIVPTPSVIPDPVCEHAFGIYWDDASKYPHTLCNTPSGTILCASLIPREIL